MAKSRKYREMFEVKIRENHGKFKKTGPNNWRVYPSPKKLRNQVPEKNSVPYWHTTPVENDYAFASNGMKVNGSNIKYSFIPLIKVQTHSQTALPHYHNLTRSKWQ